MDKVEIRNIIVRILDNECNCGQEKEHHPRIAEEISSSLTTLIIKWLENSDICDKCKNKLLTNLTDRI